MTEQTRNFILQYADADIRQLAFLGDRYPEVDLPFALDQIQGRQVARRKLPSWARRDGIIYPPHLSMEQCSSEVAAAYKGTLARDLCPEGRVFVDLTGGFGVDFAFMAAHFPMAVYVEQQPHLCKIAKSNFQVLELRSRVIAGDGRAFLRHLRHADLIFLDPARRDTAGRKKVFLSDCTPDILEMETELLQKADFVMLKLSPMLDWHEAVQRLNAFPSGGQMADRNGVVLSVHAVSVHNECKELLLVLSQSHHQALQVYAVNDGEAVDVGCPGDRKLWQMTAVITVPLAGLEGMFLYEPDAAFMKLGAFGFLTRQYPVEALGPNTHLFVSTEFLADFPGRKFQITGASPMNRKRLRSQLSGLSGANLTVRNFPMRVEELRKRWKLREGGEAYLFATTVREQEHTLIFCKKIG